MGEQSNDGDRSPAPKTPTTGDDEPAHPDHREATEETSRVLTALGNREGWQVEGKAARVHYSGASDRYSIEYYAPSECTLYWKVPAENEGETAVPVARETVPDPLRARIREDLAAAGIDPAVEKRQL
jgi:hypothetical protein